MPGILDTGRKGRPVGRKQGSGMHDQGNPEQQLEASDRNDQADTPWHLHHAGGSVR
ncbi:hypothetical protein LB566_25960 [Mesorhizobium sp. CA13]|uniref:hypothetical protein n=1 Tax=Mesorhizobium sp. CA13 TaxID=2876643 RepID=UPI001CCD9FF8|nr:hypothetical protein [Mesorhizobium sp. CA13]MBZ9857245.1 hypothetical protein [Mesorhizobium sp. CA13]